MNDDQLTALLEDSLEAGRDVTVADAAAASGLSLHDAERGLHALVSRYRGQLRVTEQGEILFRFPHGFTTPWERRPWYRSAAKALANGVESLARFIVRAWVAIVLVGYVALFVAIFIALAFGGGNRSSSRGGSRGLGHLIYLVLRLVADAFYWTFHPFSPMRLSWSRERSVEPPTEPEKRPFYEKVDRFVFGPKEPPPDPLDTRRAILAEIRAGKGRVGLADVMRITGQTRSEIDPLMSQLLVEYDGSVEVSDDGGISYRFQALRKTADDDEMLARRPPIWTEQASAPPVTGNGMGANLAIGALNAFNLLAAWWCIAQGLTIERLFALLGDLPPESVPAPGLPIALGVVPLVFSIVLFALPLLRALWRRRAVRAAKRENGRRALLETVLSTARAGETVAESTLVERYRIAAGIEPKAEEIQHHMVDLGGDVDLEGVERGAIRYRFPDLELEARAVAAEREAAAEAEAHPGAVVFSTAD